MSTPATVADLLARADDERSAGRGEAALRLYDAALARARDAGELAAWTRAALGAASAHVYGTDPGRLPAQLYDLLAHLAGDSDRARVAAALARCWAYSGRPERARPFAEEALRHADHAAAPTLVADALDALLACHWGPDDLDVRLEFGHRLDEVAAHVLEPDVRLQAHLWGLQIACEVLNLPAIHRHLRVLDRLGEESPRARLFASSRRLMYDLLRGRTDTAPALIEAASVASASAGLADGWMVVASMTVYAALQAGDTATCASIAAEAEAFAVAEGVTDVCAEAAWMWVGAGRLDRARALVRTFQGDVLDELPRDQGWLLTLQCVLEAALACGGEDAEDPDGPDGPDSVEGVIGTAARLLAPYADRAVFNTGAVAFHGLVGDPLARAAARAGELVQAHLLREQALATYVRLGATWWFDRLRSWQPAAALTARHVHLHPAGDGLWLVGKAPGTPVRALRGFTYLRTLLGRPGVEVPAVELVADGQGRLVQPAPGEALDRQALVSYRRRLVEIDQELDEAEGWADLDRAAGLRVERDALLQELRSAAGLGGRPRPTGSSHERARVAATKAISTAIDRIACVDAELARHLRTTVHTGFACRYDPEGPPVEWELS